MKDKPAVLNFKYRFNFEDGKTSEFAIQLKRGDLSLVVPTARGESPE